MSTYIDDLNWRYATKKFDAAKKISAKDLETLLEAIQLTASSYGLQPYEIIVVKDADLREKEKYRIESAKKFFDALNLKASEDNSLANQAVKYGVIDSFDELSKLVS